MLFTLPSLFPSLFEITRDNRPSFTSKVRQCYQRRVIALFLYSKPGSSLACIDDDVAIAFEKNVKNIDDPEEMARVL